MKNPNPFRYFKASPEVIRLAVMMYVRFNIIEGRRPGDNTQVAELGVSIIEANKRAQAVDLDILIQNIE